MSVVRCVAKRDKEKKKRNESSIKYCLLFCTLHAGSAPAARSATRIASIISPDKLFSFFGMFSVSVTTPSGVGVDVSTRSALDCIRLQVLVWQLAKKFNSPQ